MCGFIGMIGVDRAGAALAIGLQALQHRGQDACGIGTMVDGRVHLVRELGAVGTVFSADVVAGLRGDMGIGHVRYPTVGAGVRDDTQPFFTRRPGVLMAHNGNVTNVPALEAWLSARGVRVQSRCDVEPILLVFSEALAARRASGPTVDDVVDAVREVHARVRGAYSCAALLDVDGAPTLVAFRDPHGIRPCAYARGADGAWCVASESVAFDALGFSRVGDLPAGHLALLRPGGEPDVRAVTPRQPRPCVFERVYFARPDSEMEDGSVYATRWALGERMGEELRVAGVTADLVVPVPDTSRPAAQAIAEVLGVPFREGFIKNRYSGRTFIMPDAATRAAALRLKLNPIPGLLRGKRLLLVDDSVVRGTTVKRIADMVRTTEPAEVQLAVYSPPVQHPCFYGIDMPSRDELVAARVPKEAWARTFGVDAVHFLSPEGLRAVSAARGVPRPCMACFDGDYAVPLEADEVDAIVRDRRP